MLGQAIYRAVSAAAEETADPSPDRFVRDYVGRELGCRTRAAIEKPLAGEIDVLLEPKTGSTWDEIAGVRLLRHQPRPVVVTELDEPELFVVSGATWHLFRRGHRRRAARGPARTWWGPLRGRTAIVVETDEPAEQVMRVLGAPMVTASLVRFGV